MPAPVKPSAARVRELVHKLSDAIARDEKQLQGVRISLEDAKAIRNALIVLEGAIELGLFTVSAIARYLKG